MTYAYRWVRAGMSPLYKKQKVKRQVGVRQVEKRKGLFSSEKQVVEEPVYETVDEHVPTGKYSDCYIDIDDYARRITKACNELDEEGYDIVKISEVIEGSYYGDAKPASGAGGAIRGGYGYGYGYSVTDGVVIIGKRRAPSNSNQA